MSTCLFRFRECYLTPSDSNNIVTFATPQSNTNHHGNPKVNSIVDRSDIKVEHGGIKASSSNDVVVGSDRVKEEVCIKSINNIDTVKILQRNTNHHESNKVNSTVDRSEVEVVPVRRFCSNVVVVSNIFSDANKLMDDTNNHMIDLIVKYHTE